MSWETEFAELGRDYYPGSSKRIQRDNAAPVLAATDNSESWYAKPRRYQVNGAEYEFYSIGDLASALHRRAVTIRLWESRGYIPVAMRGPSEHESKRHRIYTRPQIEGIVRIAEEEGILHEARPRIEKTRFKEKVLDLYIELAQKPLNGATRVNEAA